MAGHSTYQPTNRFARWLDSRLPIISMTTTLVAVYAPIGLALEVRELLPKRDAWNLVAEAGPADFDRTVAVHPTAAEELVSATPATALVANSADKATPPDPSIVV